MDKRNVKEPQDKRGDNSFLRKDLLAARGRLYDRIKIPLKTLDVIICVLVGLLILAIVLGIGSNR